MAWPVPWWQQESVGRWWFLTSRNAVVVFPGVPPVPPPVVPPVVPPVAPPVVSPVVSPGVFPCGSPGVFPQWVAGPYWMLRSFTHRADLWSPCYTTGADKKKIFTGYRLRFLSIRCFLDRSPSVDQLAHFGRFEQDDIFTLDIWHFDDDQAIAGSWLVVNRSLNPNGSRPDDYGKGWLTRGGYRLILDSPGAPGGHKQIVASQEPELPQGVSV